MLLPPGIARSMSQRSKVSALSNRSDDYDWRSGGDETIAFERKVEEREAGVARGGGWGEGYRDTVSPLSPLPPVARRAGGGNGGGGGGRDVFVDGVGFSLVPKSPKQEEREELHGETVEKQKVFELSV